MASQLTLILEYYKWLLSSQFKHVILFVLLYSLIQISKKNDAFFFSYKIKIIPFLEKLHTMTEKGIVLNLRIIVTKEL